MKCWKDIGHAQLQIYLLCFSYIDYQWERTVVVNINNNSRRLDVTKAKEAFVTAASNTDEPSGTAAVVLEDGAFE